MQHVNVKVFATGPVDLAAAVPVFHRWIQDGACEELLIDVADYTHVPAGPGVILIGHEANYSLDNSGNRPGLLYNRKAPLDGGAGENVAQAVRAARAACDRLEREPEFEGRLRFDHRHLEITINDRLLAPNTEESLEALKPAIAVALGTQAIELVRIGEPRQRLRAGVRVP
jgi:hypothetical protein